MARVSMDLLVLMGPVSSYLVHLKFHLVHAKKVLNVKMGLV